MKNFRRYIPVVALAAVLGILSGCKKDEPEKEYLDGTIRLELPTYVAKGYTKQFKIDTLATITAADGSGVGYYFNNTVTGKRDTVMLRDGSYAPGFPGGVYTYTVGDKTGNSSLSLIAFGSEKYYSTSGKAFYTVVDPAMDGTGSLTGFNRAETEHQFTDERDGHDYWYTEVDGTMWMTQNLGWRGAGAPFYNSEIMAEVLGQYYTWDDARTACPEGWRLPSEEEVKSFATSFGAVEDSNGSLVGMAGDFMADLYFNGSPLWPYWPGVNITNAACMYLIPTGYAIVNEGKYEFPNPLVDSEGTSIGYSLFWTGDELDGRGVYRYIYEDQNIIFQGLASKDSFAAPVRCVK